VTVTGLYVHRSHRLERLADLLGDALRADPPADPFLGIPVIVGSRGMARWLKHALADRLGLCAGVSFPFPAPFLDAAMAEVVGDELPSRDGWSPDALAWHVLAVLADLLPLEELAPVRRALGVSELPDPLRRHDHAVARSLADVLDRYAHARPDWIAAWRAGRLALPEARDAETWQALLWRALEARLGPGHAAGRLDALQKAIDTGAARAPRDHRVHLFGLSALPPLFLHAFALLARLTRIDLYLLAPSEGYFGDYRTRPEARRLLRRASPTARAALEAGLAGQHPLLTGLGRVSRDFQELLEDVPGDLGGLDLFGDEAAPGRSTLLVRLQAQLRELIDPRDVPASERFVVARDDDSLRVHAAAGPTRQVEVLRDALLGLLEAHPDLQPRDIVVMTPDVETYAPLVASAFGDGAHEPGPPPTDDAGNAWGPAGAPRLPVEISDLSLRRTNPLADVLLTALELAGQRVTATVVADLMGRPALQRRFGLSGDDVDAARGWLAASGIRWGIDAADRARFGQPADPQNTFRFGLMRLALGAAAGEEDALFRGGVVPSAVDEGSVAAFGRFAAFCSVLFEQLEALREPRDAEGWRTTLVAALEALTSPGDEEGWLREQVQAGLDATCEEARGWQGRVAPEAILHALQGRFGVPTSGERPPTGAISVCALAPLRSVPFRVVAVLGLDDATFPRRGAQVGFDLTRVAPRLGDRDARDEDRHLLLEALLSARDHVVLCFTGRDASSGEPLPPAVPLADLLDALDATFAPPEGARSVREVVLIEHPVPPFSARAFSSTAAGDATSFDRRLRDVARALAGSRAPRTGFFDRTGAAPVVPSPALEVRLDDLARVLQSPLRALLQRRYGLFLDERADALEDREPVEPARRDLARVEVALLAERVAAARRGEAWEPRRASAMARQVARGELPLGAAGRVDLALAAAAVERLAEAAGDLPARTAPAALDLPLEGGRRLVGRADAVEAASGTLVDLDVAPVDRASRRLRAWLGVLALQAVDPRDERSARLFGLKGGAEAVDVRLVAPAGDAARELLVRLVALHDAALSGPLPLFEGASAAVAAELVKRGVGAGWSASDAAAVGQALSRVASGWWGDARRRGDGDDPYVDLVHPAGPPFTLSTAARAAFLDAAELVWGPIVAAGGGE